MVSSQVDLQTENNLTHNRVAMVISIGSNNQQSSVILDTGS